MQYNPETVSYSSIFVGVHLLYVINTINQKYERDEALPARHHRRTHTHARMNWRT